MHMQHMQGMQTMGAETAASDTRAIVHFPDQMRIHTLAHMRDHLLALSEIQEALALGKFEKAGEIAEQRLGMTAMKLHGAKERSQYMPEAMAAIGSEMHRAASRFAVAASNAAVVDEVRPALAALSDVTRQCVACHNGFRVQ
ncbi:MAG: hypothetical protein A2286_03125 [Gammaproteobacteria bacterium RIFOXYA12_FULL_61_12]|nr:MAG: hypothetical protein A2514_00965 [Gammaproteobacteria bacterium RIFOXYD12_FULL_61_37]OGT93894.1 MAG: hypothetical protein A2286_03125 [Gammaproteobacteria bacterium RIFOXYA12_FULL_61_12]